MDPDRQGQPGEPGLPGLPGEGGGGYGGGGGAGGRGGHGTTGEHYRLFVFIVVLAVALSIGTLILALQVKANGQRIERIEDMNARLFHQSQKEQDAAIKAARASVYNVCLRQMVVRAAMDMDRRTDERRLPLYDCSPNIYGSPAVLMTSSQRRKFENYVRTTPTAQLP